MPIKRVVGTTHAQNMRAWNSSTIIAPSYIVYIFAQIYKRNDPTVIFSCNLMSNTLLCYALRIFIYIDRCRKICACNKPLHSTKAKVIFATLSKVQTYHVIVSSSI